VGDQERVEALLQKDAGLASRLDSARIRPLSYAAREGHLHIVRLLLEHGADPNTPEDAAPDGRALYEACCGNHLQVAELLLNHNANPNAGVDSCECCLTIGEHYHGDRAKPLQQLLRRHGAVTPPYAMSARESRQALGDDHEADPANVVACPRSPALVRKLLARGLDPNQTDWLGKTFLHECAARGDRSVAAVLLDAGADIDAREVEFQGTPLAAAVRSYCAVEDSKQAERARRMVEFLLERGARTNLPGDEPWATPLAWAARYGRGELVELLTNQPGVSAEGGTPR
jgi:ankyrin repeat protein